MSTIVSAADLATIEFEGRALPKPFGPFLGEIEPKTAIFVWGPPGSGKTTWVLDLAGLLAAHTDVLFVASEQRGPGRTLQDKAARLKLPPHVHFTDFDDLATLKRQVKRGYGAVVVDSAQSVEALAGRGTMNELRAWCESRAVMCIYMAHAYKDGSTYKGDSAWAHYAGIEVHIEDGVARTRKNRYTDLGEMKVRFAVPKRAKIRRNPSCETITYDDAISSKAATSAQKEAQARIKRLYTHHGTWKATAKALDVSTSTLRNWRDGMPITKSSLALLSAQCDLIEPAPKTKDQEKSTPQTKSVSAAKTDSDTERAGDEDVKAERRARFKEKRDRREERFSNKADKNRQEASQRFESVREMANVLQGEPIKVGHHSERRHRKAIDRMDTNMEKGSQAHKKAKHYERKAESVGKGGVSADDPDALVKMRKKLEKMEQQREQMKRLNRAWRIYTKDPTKAKEMMDAEGISEKVQKETFALTSKPFGYQLTNLGANIRRVKERIEELEKAAAEQQQSVTIGDVTVTNNLIENRVQIRFRGKPSKEVRDTLKRWGYRWARSQGAWQRQIKPGRFEAAVKLVRETEAPEGAQEPQAEAGTPKGAEDSSVQYMNFMQLHVNPRKFQPREDEFSEASVQRIVENFDVRELDPLRVWLQPYDQTYYVLAGHSRWEAIRRLIMAGKLPGDFKVPVHVYEGTESEAIDFAHRENNKGTEQSAAENAVYLRRFIGEESKSALRDRARTLYGRNGNTVLYLAHLAPNGSALSALRLFSGQSTSESRDVETMAAWLGQLRMSDDRLTAAHENEIFAWLKENYKTRGKKVTNYGAFSEWMRKVIEQRSTFGELPERLNIAGVIPVSKQQQVIDRQVRDAEKALKAAKRDLEAKRRELVRRGASKADLGRVLKRYNEAVTIAQRDLLHVREQAAGAGAQLKRQEVSLFNTMRANPSGALIYLGTVADIDGLAGGYELFHDAIGNRLLAVPPVNVERVESIPEDAGAIEQFEAWNGYEADGGMAVSLPGDNPISLGFASSIRYTSDKLLETGDEKGKPNAYQHQFDTGKRRFYAWGDAYLVDDVEVSSRGILN